MPVLTPLRLLATLVLACHSPLWAAGMLHISTTGSDKTGEGTIAAPWATLKHAVEKSAPGDTILLAPGTYKQRTEIYQGGSKEGGFLTIMGEDGAVISGEGVKGETSVLVQDQSFVRLVNLSFTGNSSKKESYGVLIQGGDATNVEVVNCKFTKLLGKNAVAIAVHGTDPSKPLRNIKITDCHISNCEPAPSEAIALNGNVDGFEVSRNVVMDVNNIAIDFIGGEKATVEDATKVARNGICRGNRVERARSSYGGGYAAGIYVDGGRDILIENNIITECDMGIELGAENKGTLTSGITVRGNQVFLNDKAGIAIGGYEAAVGRVKNCTVTGNIFYKNTSGRDPQGELWLQHGTDNTITQNSFWVSTGRLMVAASSGGLKNKVNQNQWWSESGPAEMQWQWGDDPTKGFKEFLAYSQQEKEGAFRKPEHPNPEKGEFQEVSMN